MIRRSDGGSGGGIPDSFSSFYQTGIASSCRLSKSFKARRELRAAAVGWWCWVLDVRVVQNRVVVGYEYEKVFWSVKREDQRYGEKRRVERREEEEEEGQRRAVLCGVRLASAGDSPEASMAKFCCVMGFGLSTKKEVEQMKEEKKEEEEDKKKKIERER
ncbi:hypothetical protein M0802_002592 [Mischocyttarus mexicanus]|nr:hypothetical protein M0802_002592 [Mischocyttarus mexicanus]